MKARTVVRRGVTSARYVTPDLSYEWEGAGEVGENVVNGMGTNKQTQGRHEDTPSESARVGIVMAEEGSYLLEGVPGPVDHC